MANAYVARQEHVVTSKESRQFGLMTAVTLDQVVDIVTEMSEFNIKTIAKALEFFRTNESSHKIFLKFSHALRVTCIQEVTFTG